MVKLESEEDFITVRSSAHHHGAGMSNQITAGVFDIDLDAPEAEEEELSDEDCFSDVQIPVSMTYSCTVTFILFK